MYPVGTSIKQAGIDGSFQQRATRRPNKTVVIIVYLVNLIL